MQHRIPEWIPREALRRWSTAHEVNKYLRIGGMSAIYWLQKRKADGCPVPSKTQHRQQHGAVQVYQLLTVMGIAMGAGLEITPADSAVYRRQNREELQQELKNLREEVRKEKNYLTELRCQVSVLLDCKKQALERPNIIQRLGPYLYTEADIVGAAVPFRGGMDRCGVYFLVSGDSVVYVGQSTNVWSRLSIHLKEKQFESVAFLPCPVELLDRAEAFYIHFFKPKLNGRHANGAMMAPTAPDLEHVSIWKILAEPDYSKAETPTEATVVDITNRYQDPSQKPEDEVA